MAEIKAKIETFKARNKEFKKKYVSPHVIFFSSPFL